jgi:hypothetical protein
MEPIAQKRPRAKKPAAKTIEAAAKKAKYEQGQNTMSLIVEFLKCVICFESGITKEMVTTPCGHIYHADCLKEAQQRGPCRGLCPTCKKEIQVNDSTDELGVIQTRLGALAELTVSCNHNDCDWMGSYDEWEKNHDGVCPFKRYACGNASNGCDFEGIRAEVTDHMNETCEKHRCACDGTKCKGYAPLRVLNSGCPHEQFELLEPYLQNLSPESPSYSPMSPSYSPTSPSYVPRE